MVMTILRKIINDKKIEQKKHRNRELTLSMALGATIGVLTGIIVSSKSDKINKTLKSMKDKNLKYMKIGKGNMKDFVSEKVVEIKDIKDDLKKEFIEKKEKAQDIKEIVEDKIDEGKEELRDISEETLDKVREELQNK